jgi:hypothetical protein
VLKKALSSLARMGVSRGAGSECDADPDSPDARFELELESAELAALSLTGTYVVTLYPAMFCVRAVRDPDARVVECSLRVNPGDEGDGGWGGPGAAAAAGVGSGGGASRSALASGIDLDGGREVGRGSAGAGASSDAVLPPSKLTSRRDAIGVVLSLRSRRGGRADTRRSARGSYRLRRKTRRHHDGRDSAVAGVSCSGWLAHPFSLAVSGWGSGWREGGGVFVGAPPA